ncbi:hypothetical protein [Methylobacterium oxalidis]|uniref:hypothetical protein n=1 Tax=Methylobacterium oxalidis TaxID=944322 RepID=UPI003314FE05
MKTIAILGICAATMMTLTTAAAAAEGGATGAGGTKPATDKAQRDPHTTGTAPGANVGGGAPGVAGQPGGRADPTNPPGPGERPDSKKK